MHTQTINNVEGNILVVRCMVVVSCFVISICSHLGKNSCVNTNRNGNFEQHSQTSTNPCALKLPAYVDHNT